MRGIRIFIPPLAFVFIILSLFFSVYILLSYNQDTILYDANVDRPVVDFENNKQQTLEVDVFTEADLTDFVDRPLLSPGRQAMASQPLEREDAPTVEVPVVVDVAPPVLPELQYHGYFDGGGRRAALITLPENNKQQWIEVGTTLSGWKVDEITSEYLLLSSGNEKTTIQIGD